MHHAASLDVTIPEDPALHLAEWGCSWRWPPYEANSTTHHRLRTSTFAGVWAFYHKTPSVEADPPQSIRSGCVLCWLRGGHLDVAWESVTSWYLLFMLQSCLVGRKFWTDWGKKKQIWGGEAERCGYFLGEMWEMGLHLSPKSTGLGVPCVPEASSFILSLSVTAYPLQGCRVHPGQVTSSWQDWNNPSRSHSHLQEIQSHQLT